jgi:hypothetical protein
VMVPYRTDLFWSERREPIYRPHRSGAGPARW